MIFKIYFEISANIQHLGGMNWHEYLSKIGQHSFSGKIYTFFLERCVSQIAQKKNTPSTC